MLYLVLTSKNDQMVLTLVYALLQSCRNNYVHMHHIQAGLATDSVVHSTHLVIYHC